MRLPIDNMSGFVFLHLAQHVVKFLWEGDGHSASMATPFFLRAIIIRNIIALVRHSFGTLTNGDRGITSMVMIIVFHVVFCVLLSYQWAATSWWSSFRSPQCASDPWTASNFGLLGGKRTRFLIVTCLRSRRNNVGIGHAADAGTCRDVAETFVA